jgi:hypothetical protein
VRGELSDAFVFDMLFWWLDTMPVRGMLCSNKLALFLICFGGLVHNMDKKVTTFSEKKTKNN